MIGPYDEDPGCDVCFRATDDCICPECPHCGEIGNLECYVPGPAGLGHLRLSGAQHESRAMALEQQRRQAEADDAFAREIERADAEFWQRIGFDPKGAA
jgi:hypothetical protein